MSLTLIEAPLSGVVAGFTTRFGGHSAAPYGELNLGLNVGDEPDTVARNRSEVAQSIGVPLRFLRQVHSARAVVFSADSQFVDEFEADASVATSAGLGLGVLVADCVPILLADAARGVVAVAHAGREGIESEVIASCVATMRDAGAVNIAAVIGPAICGRCYEVPAAMREAVSNSVPQAYGETRWGTPGLDLPAAAAAQLAAQGVADVKRLDICTYEDERFYSHRRSGHSGLPATGRFAGIIALQT